ncbi:hypothetical protein CgunFtcFv8_015952 [Champsocephalus gunnari]|uniref:Uncharacterized protein n=1 Tax=Champsocephalus gunnari TaxID=52237 RepID=A0AAN8C7M6_CHAGU|nr:hypothetical protein CgunFtcFv8_015952 [Champsocephalus gunnari]
MRGCTDIIMQVSKVSSPSDPSHCLMSKSSPQKLLRGHRAVKHNGQMFGLTDTMRSVSCSMKLYMTAY